MSKTDKELAVDLVKAMIESNPSQAFDHKVHQTLTVSDVKTALKDIYSALKGLDSTDSENK